jgi:hypothetical protein
MRTALLLIQMAAELFAYLRDRHQRNIGRKEAHEETEAQIKSDIEKADAVRKEIRSNPSGDYAGGVRKKYTRPKK